jgi:hypothetical protein
MEPVALGLLFTMAVLVTSAGIRSLIQRYARRRGDWPSGSFRSRTSVRHRSSHPPEPITIRPRHDSAVTPQRSGVAQSTAPDPPDAEPSPAAPATEAQPVSSAAPSREQTLPTRTDFAEPEPVKPLGMTSWRRRSGGLVGRRRGFSVSEVQPPVSEVQPPVSELQPPVSEVQPPVSELQPPVSELQPPVSEVQPPVSEVQPPVSEVSGAHPTRPFPDELLVAAAMNAGGWVYDVDPAFSGAGSIFSERIMGAWRIDDMGWPTGEFVVNAQYRLPSSTRRRLGRRVWVPVILVLVAVVTAAALVLFVFPQTKVDKGVTVTPKLPSASTPAANGVPGSAHPAAHKAPAAAGSGAARHPAHTPAAGRSASVRLEVLADARVWACLQDQRGRLLINGQILPAGTVSQQFVSPAFRIFLGSGAVRLRIDGRVQSLPPSSNLPAFGVSKRGVAVLKAGTVAACA